MRLMRLRPAELGFAPVGVLPFQVLGLFLHDNSGYEKGNGLHRNS